jgi:ABC-type phosphate transport system substrate-binding protein
MRIDQLRKTEDTMKFHRLIQLFVLVLLIVTPRAAFAGDLVIIVNTENPVSDLSPQEIRKYMLKEAKSWPNGKKVRSVDRKGSPPERKAYLSSVVKKNSDQLEKYWVSQRYKNGVRVPPRMGDDQQIIEYIGTFSGAIGYVNSDSVNDGQGSGVKAVGTFSIK